jgi:MFS family permease
MAAVFNFTIGSVVAAAATNFTVLLAGRSIQGVGGGRIIALTYVIVSDMVSLRDRGNWFGIISLHWAIGAIFGPIIGGGKEAL